jgi:hypothetical protein
MSNRNKTLQRCQWDPFPPARHRLDPARTLRLASRVQVMAHEAALDGSPDDVLGLATPASRC